eukprot:TRINITY_DN9624_c0_g1_i1.p1 TRINITY_DN9624_c0_g1~~TRINITY_DN9624_c0_g1_i1.p1  ORF type:complete len:392 (+),score=133.98 TRINITY_DN9624_c0_g1_i1:192-1367(+)
MRRTAGVCASAASRWAGAPPGAPRLDLDAVRAARAAVRALSRAAPPGRSDADAAQEVRKHWHRSDGRGAAAPLLPQALAAMRQQGWEVGEAAHAAAMTVMGLRKRPKQAEAIHWSMVEGGLRPTPTTYAALLQAFVDGNSCQRVPYLWYCMTKDGVAPNRACYDALLAALSAVGDHGGCQEALEEMRAAGLEPGHATHLAVAAAMPRVAEAEAYLQKQVIARAARREHERGKGLYAGHIGEEVVAVLLKVCRRTRDTAGSDDVYRRYRHAYGSPHFVCAYAEVHYLAGEYARAAKIFKRVQPPSRGSYEGLLRVLLVTPGALEGDGLASFSFYVEAALAEWPRYAPFYELGISGYLEAGEAAAARGLDAAWRAAGTKASPGLLELSKHVGM